MLTVVDEYTRECHLIHVDRGIRATTVRDQLFRLIERHGAPEYIRSDNGSEFIEKSLQAWLRIVEIKTLFIEPGSPWQNGYIERFHSRFREECLPRLSLVKGPLVSLITYHTWCRHERGPASTGW